ncbi:MAG: tRNA pseudouridine(38-40) synthase TruA [Calditrichia bacterium]
MSERNIRLLVEYDGSAYHGWQSQENALSVQEVLEHAIKKLTQEERRVTAAGRTDAGVHARGQVVNFLISKPLPLNKFPMGLNAHLPGDVVVKKAEEVPLEFNARFDARKRVYQYYMMAERTAIYRNYCWQFFRKMDREMLQPLAEMLVGTHDFGAFSRLEVQSPSKRCQVYESTWREEGNFLIYRIVANRFLHGMVRTIVGTMIDVARGRFTPQQFETIFRSQDRTQAGTAAPARGLFLEEVIYQE